MNANTRPTRSSLPLLALTPLLLLAAIGCANTRSEAPAEKGQAFWPPFPEQPHVQFLTSYAVTSDINPKQNKLEEIMYGKEGNEGLVFNKPYGLRMHDGKIYVCDTNHNALIVLDVRKHEVRLVGVSGEGKLAKPVDVAVADDGTKYVADSQRPAIYVFDKADKFVRLIGARDFRPVSVAVRGDELYCCDFKNHKILVWNRHTGQQIRTIGKPGREKGELGGPLGLALDKDGNIYVSEIVNCRIQKFGPDGRFIRAFGVRGDQVGAFTRPKHIAVDSEGIIYVVDAAFQNVQMINSSFKPLMAFGGHGAFPGYMDLPAGVSVHEKDLDLFKQYIHPAFEAQRLILVSNQWGDNRVAVYAMGKLKDGKTINDIAASRNVVPQDRAADQTSAAGATTRPAVGAPVAPTDVPHDLKE